MRCASRCHEIGGPWIAEDPDCPVHGREAQLRERAEETSKSELLGRIEELERRVRRLEDRLP